MINSNLLVMVGGIIVILIAISAFSMSEEKDKSFSQILTVGPVWTTNSWICTSDEDFMIHGTIRGLAGSLLEINISDVGTQSLYGLDAGQMESFSIGTSGSNQITLTKSGTVTGFLTLQTVSNAEASCIPL